MYDPISQDPPGKDPHKQTMLEHVVMDSHGCELYGMMYRARGRESHPTAVILHGFPGHERNLDLGHVLCRAGWNSLIFHYRGSWGSQGDFGFHNVLEDVSSCLSYLRDRRRARRLGVDAGRIVLIGHSMGGWAALLEGVRDPMLKEICALAPFNFSQLGRFVRDDPSRKMIEKDMKEMIRPLRGSTLEGVYRELWSSEDEFDVAGRCGSLEDKRVLLVGAKRDTVSIPEHHHIPIERALAGNPSVDLTSLTLDTDHSFTDRRVALARAVLKWLEGGG